MSRWPGADRYAGLARTAGAQYGVPWTLVMAVMAVESGFNPDAINPNDPSYGLMQVTPPTARDRGFTGDVPEDLLDPVQNVELGTAHLRWLMDRSALTAWSDVLSAYNGGIRPHIGMGVPYRGETPIEACGRTVRPGEYCNQRYVDDVVRAWQYFRTDYQGTAPAPEPEPGDGPDSAPPGGPDGGGELPEFPNDNQARAVSWLLGALALTSTLGGGEDG